MSEGSSRLSTASLKRKKLEKRYRNITMNKEIMPEREIVQGVFELLDEHKKVMRSLKLCMKDIENQMGMEENSKLLEKISRAVRRDMRVLKNLKIMSFKRIKEMKMMKKMKKKMIKLKVVEDGEKNEGSNGENEGDEGESDDDAPRLCDDLKKDDWGAKGADGEDDEYSTEIENEALRLREFIKEDDYTYIPPGEDKVNYRKWARYYKQIRESKGFDVDDCPGHCLNTFVVPLGHYLKKDSEFHLEITQLAINAINVYNLKEGASYEFHNLVRVNSQIVAGVMYLLTFEATDPKAAYAIKTFQAKIHCGCGPPDMRKTEVVFCRLKNPSQEVVV